MAGEKSILAGRLMMSFEDHFSALAETYANHRPRYPQALFSYLASIAVGHDLAWDVGTGNGQAAISLADYFQRVVATDASDSQIASRMEHANVDYRVEPAEQPSLEDDSVDLITSAVAAHWFDLDRFYHQVRRVAKKGAPLVLWTYFFCNINEELDSLIADYFYNLLDGYWSDRIRYLEQGYRTLPFPFKEIQAPEFIASATWNLDDLKGFLLSWSGTASYIEANGDEAVRQFLARLAQAWGDPSQAKQVQWDLYMRAGQVE